MYNKKEYAREYYKQNRDYLIGFRNRNPRSVENSRLKFLYGITLERFEEMAREQDYKCGICLKERKLCVDHDHITNTVRRLVCKSCNGHLAWFERNKEKIISYLKKMSM